MVVLYSRHIPEHKTLGIFQIFLLEVSERETFRSQIAFSYSKSNCFILFANKRFTTAH